MLAKTAGKFATKPSAGPHKASECLPLVVFLRDRLKYALNAREVQTIVKRRLVKIDGKVRVDPRFPAGLMDVIELGKNGEIYRLIYDCKGRYTVHKIEKKEAEFKLCRINKYIVGSHGVPQLVTHDGRTLRYVDPSIRMNDTVKLNIKTGQVETVVKFQEGNVAMVTAGGNVGRVGIIERIEKQIASFDIIHMKDAAGNKFATRIANVFVIGQGETPLITLPRRAGVRPSILENIQQ